jgi:hypothetical protein
VPCSLNDKKSGRVPRSSRSCAVPKNNIPRLPSPRFPYKAFIVNPNPRRNVDIA